MGHALQRAPAGARPNALRKCWPPARRRASANGRANWTGSGRAPSKPSCKGRGGPRSGDNAPGRNAGGAGIG
eukprot:6774771-Lingulodinium_polyedra.AAC.1